MAATCAVCGEGSVRPLMTIAARAYYRCPICAATLLDRAAFPDDARERAEYDLHRNPVDDPGYRRFLSRLCDPLLARLLPGSEGLDYGCGPGPALAAMLHEAGHRVDLYDPFYAPDPRPLSRQYDFVTCTEVVEHFHDPASEFARLRGLLRPGGWLAVMTCFQTDDSRFADWHYRKDPTHVVFYRDETFRHLARRWGWDCTIPLKDVVLMRKPSV